MPRVGIALSGGAAKGDFEVGAVRYLYAHVLKEPPYIVAGTSVGAINAIKLVEGENMTVADRPGYASGLVGLERIWLALQANDDMYTIQPWVNQQGQHVRELLLTRNLGRFDEPPDPTAVWNVITGVMTLGIGFIVDLVEDASFLGSLKDEFDTLKKALDDTANPAQSIYTLAPIRTKLQGDSLSLPLVSSGAIKLRLCAVSLQTGKVDYVDEQGRLLRRPGAPSVGLVDAVLASAGAPPAFPPVVLAGEPYVDGGVGELTPVQAIMEAPIDQGYAVVASPPIADEEGFATKNVFDISFRSVDIVQDVNSQKTLTPPSAPWKAPLAVIRPTVQVHDSDVVNPGLIRISLDYGYLSAWLATTPGLPSTLAETLGGIFDLRRQAHKLEEEMIAFYPGPGRILHGDPAAYSDRWTKVRTLKQQLAVVLGEWIAAGGLPHAYYIPNFDDWVRNWEFHSTRPYNPPNFPDARAWRLWGTPWGSPWPSYPWAGTRSRPPRIPGLPDAIGSGDGAFLAIKANVWGRSVAQELSPGRYDLEQLLIGNDSIGYVLVPDGWRVTVYSESRFWGQSVAVTAAWNVSPSFGVSSVVAERLWAVAYAGRDFTGQKQLFAPGRYDLGQLTIPNDTISSLRVPLGWTITAYSEAGFWGDSGVFNADTGWVGATLGNRISSLVIDGPPGIPPPPSVLSPPDPPEPPGPTDVDPPGHGPHGPHGPVRDSA